MVLVPGIVIAHAVVVRELDRLPESLELKMERIVVDLGRDFLEARKQRLGSGLVLDPGHVTLPRRTAWRVRLTAIALNRRFAALQRQAEFDDAVTLDGREVISDRCEGRKLVVVNRLKSPHRRARFCRSGPAARYHSA